MKKVVTTRSSASTKFVIWAFLVGIAIASFTVFLSVQVTRGFAETAALRGEVLRSYEERGELQHLLSLLQDLETGQRGYILTKNADFLRPYETADSQIEGVMDHMTVSVPASMSGEQEMGEIVRLVEGKRRFVAQTVSLAKDDRSGEAIALIASGKGKQLMDRTRQIIAAMDRSERSQLNQKTDAVAAAQTRLQTTIVVLQILLIVALGIALGLLLRAYNGWQRTLRGERDMSARQQAIFQSARDGMIMINASGSIESLNPAAGQLFGYDTEELLRRDVGMLFEIAPDRGRMETFLDRLALDEAAEAGTVRDIAARRKDGSIFPAAVSVSVVEFEGERRFLAVLRDVTERLQIDQMKTEFVSTVSHELRTPLTSIAGSLGLIAGGAAGSLPDRAHRLLEIAQSNCARLIRLINDILDVEKIESGKMHFDIKPLLVSELLEQAVEANREFASGLDVEILLGAAPEKAKVMGDEDRLMQVFTNLLSNAAKFSQAKGSVQITVRPLDRRYRISIADRGSGISEEFRNRIFTKFAQEDSSDTRSKGGTGLGLSIVREIVDRLGGAISFESTPGQGTTFHVDLPAAADDRQDDPAAQLLGRISSVDLPIILHVDDDPDMLRIVSSAFEGRAQVHSCASMAEGQAAIRRYDFDTVILDIAMVDGDGLELIPLIRQRRKTPIVLFTAQDAEPGKTATADLVLTKSRDSLDRLVSEVMARAGRPQAEEA